MKTLRKIDWYGQLILFALMVMALPALFLYGFPKGLLLLGCWQLISAILNTYTFIHESFKAQILLYWKICIADLAVLFSFRWVDKIYNSVNTQVILWIAIAASVIIAVYYLKIYFKLLGRLSLRNELHGLIKSNH
jgi:hypothetical protein